MTTYRVGGNRNFGYGKKMEFAGLQALRDRYAGGHFASVDAHSSRWGTFCDWSIERGVKDARNITIEHVNAYVAYLKNEVLEGELKPSYAQNLVSSVNTVLSQMRGDDAIWAKPSEVGERCAVRDTAPLWVSRDDVSGVRARIDESRFAAMIDLAREFGLRFRECSRLDAAHALRQAVRSAQITVSEGVKGGNQERTVPITSQRQIDALRAAVAAQQGGLNLMRADQTYSQFKNQAYKAFYAAGGSHFHDLRAAYACDRYHELTGCMREFSDWEIVISSSWREQFDLDELRGFFSPDIACRIIGVTPVFLTAACGRQREIEQYLKNAQSGSPWIALDDAAHEFEPGLSCLIVCRPEVGFDARAANDLRMKMGESAGAG